MADFTVRTMKKSAVFLNETKLRGRSEQNASFVVPWSVTESNKTGSYSTNDKGLCCKTQDDTSAVIPVCVQSFVDNFHRFLPCPGSPPLPACWQTGKEG